MFDIRDYGAIGDGKNKNTAAIQAAVDACAAAGGGRVLVPSGRWLTGTIVLKSFVELHLEAGAVLLGSTDIRDYLDLDKGHPLTVFNTPILFSYFRRPFLYAEKAEHISITGTGTIDGQSGWNINFPNPGDETLSRPILIIMREVRKLRIHDVTLKDPAMWTTRFERCEDVSVSGVTIRSMRTNNGDGLDFAGGKNIRISNCDIEAGDDCISLKMFERGDEIRNVTVTNCVLRSWWCGFRIGGETNDNCSEITMSNCVIDCSGDGIKIHSCGGAVSENMNFSNIIMRNVDRPVFLVADTYTFDTKPPCRPNGSVIRNINFDNLTVVHRHDLAWRNYVGDKIEGSVISGSYEGVVEDVRFNNIRFEAEGGVEDQSLGDPVVYEFVDYMDKYAEAREFRRPCVPASGLFLRRVRNCTFRNVHFASRLPDVRPRLIALRCEDCSFEVTATADERCKRPILADLCERCEFTGTKPSAFTEDERKRERENDRVYSQIYWAQEEEAAAVDAARLMPNDRILKAEKAGTGAEILFELEQLPQEAYLYFAWVKGRAEFYCNGVKLGERKFPVVEGYRNIMVDIEKAPEGGYRGVSVDRYEPFYEREYFCAFPLNGILKKGLNRVEVKSDDFTVKWPVHLLWK